MRLLLIMLPVIATLSMTPKKAQTVDHLLRQARCESYCYTQCFKMVFAQLKTSFCESCKSTCPEARLKASRQRISNVASQHFIEIDSQTLLTPMLRVRDRRRGEIELDVTLSSSCEHCLIVLEYRFMTGLSNTASKWIPFQIVTPGIYAYSGLQIDYAYQFRTNLVYLWQRKKTAVTQWVDLSLQIEY